MALLKKDSKIPQNAPKELLMKLHSDFLFKYSDNKEDYEYVMSEFLRINGIYWSLTAMDLLHDRDRLNEDEVRWLNLELTFLCIKVDLSDVASEKG